MDSRTHLHTGVYTCMYINTHTSLLFFLKFIHQYLSPYISVSKSIHMCVCMFAYICTHRWILSPTAFMKASRGWELIQSSLQIEISEHIFSEWPTCLKPSVDPPGQTSTFLFNFQLCFYRTLSKWMCKRAVPNKFELKRLSSGMGSSDSLLKHTKSSFHFSLSFSHTWTNCLASCHWSKLKKFNLSSVTERKSRTSLSHKIETSQVFQDIKWFLKYLFWIQSANLLFWKC